ncbi:5-oxoprolinase subunit PxpB [Xylophilus rhododendri]|uniref:5-oxoprolinase subunit PxpB n=2 Tax=Xylophilus rhododendri TaxID=2697032 RepID=A0A857JC54_9BURK|nr:5-oxoprolinase subunit PxpB [Xylophilus rhododendri]
MPADGSIEPVGDRCLMVRLGAQVDEALSRLVHAVAARLLDAALPGVVDVVPAFTTVAVYFQPLAFRAVQGLPSVQLTRQIEQVLAAGVPALASAGRLVEIPACYGGEYGPDLEDVARQCQLSPEEVVTLHSSRPLTVYAFFFSPGNAFAGPVDVRLQVKRRPTPRTRVEAGSVAIANGISSIYQTTSPGGWNLLGRTPWNMFDITADPPTRVQLGDRIQFRPITPEEFRDTVEARP